MLCRFPTNICHVMEAGKSHYFFSLKMFPLSHILSVGSTEALGLEALNAFCQAGCSAGISETAFERDCWVVGTWDKNEPLRRVKKGKSALVWGLPFVCTTMEPTLASRPQWGCWLQSDQRHVPMLFSAVALSPELICTKYWYGQMGLMCCVHSFCLDMASIDQLSVLGYPLDRC